MKRFSHFTLVVSMVLPAVGIICSANGGTFQFREPSIRNYVTVYAPAANSETASNWLKARENGPGSRNVLLGHKLVLKLAPTTELVPLLKHHNLSVERVVADDLMIVSAANATLAASAANAIRSVTGVIACYPIMRKEIELDAAYARRPSDYYFKLQTYHEFRDENGSRIGVDINSRAAWPYTTGEGVIIGIADTGIQPSHPDIANQLADGKQHNFSTDEDDGSSTGLFAAWVHGMSVAGLAVAEGNNETGMIGVAPGAKVASWVIFDENLLRVGEDKLMDLYTSHNDTVWVQNHSWGGGDVHELVDPGLLEIAGISEAVESGRDGKGVIMVRSGGNRRLVGGNANYSLYPSDPRVIGVAAVDGFGRVASYSNPGASLLVSAPGGDESGPHMFTLDFLEADGATTFKLWLPGETEQTQDLWNYRYDFNPFKGTSAAAPLVSGVCALMLSANPDLTYRDVQTILTLAAKHQDTTDPELHLNGAGFPVSHNQGFGIIDAGTAVRLAKGWVNRPAENSGGYTIAITRPIPDDGYRLKITGTGISTSLNYITNRSSLGPIADDGTAPLPIVDVGLANDPINLDLTGKVALIERGITEFSVKISNAAEAGAEFAIVFNNVDGSISCPGGDALCPMGGTDFTTIPAVFIGNSQGEAIKSLLLQQTDTRARIEMNSAEIEFQIANTLAMEHVGARVRTDHPLRGDLRVTLVAPSGTRSVMQRFNADTNAGPVDWTYYSTHHFHECSAGTWKLELSDHAQGAAGNVLEAGLQLFGTAISDEDFDGLDDDWEMVNFTSLDEGPTGDPDKDGYSNVREQVMQTNPNVGEIPFELAPAAWDSEMVRLSWPGVEGASYQMLSGANVANLTLVTNLAGSFPETVWFTDYTNLQQRFFLLRRLPQDTPE